MPPFMSRIVVSLLVLAVCILRLNSQAGTLVQFRTIFGNLDVELYDQEKPVTTDNFKRLIKSGAYQNTFFHRVVPGFVAQGGGFFSYAPASTNLFNPPWSLMGSVPNFGSITNEFNVGPLLSNTNGTIAMAKLGNDPNSATSQWFFNLNNNSTNLDNQNGGFTVFGRVIRDTGPTNTGGMLGLFNAISYGNGLVNMGWWYPSNDYASGVFNQLPVTYPGYYDPWHADLFYVNVTLLSVQVTHSNNTHQISWNSVNGLTNVVEVTTQMPPVWNALTTTNGTGSRITVTDPAAADRFRFYRVRVIY